jgi:succinoglycan biosynthesis protein ExoA
LVIFWYFLSLFVVEEIQMTERGSQTKYAGNNREEAKESGRGIKIPADQKNKEQVTKEAPARFELQKSSPVKEANKQYKEQSVHNKTVTVIMPIRNEAEFIQESLSAVLNQDYPAGLVDILVVDGMSTDDTCSIVHEVQNQNPNVQLINNPGKIVPIGLNIALSQARGEIVVRVDGHCVIHPEYIRRCVEYLERENVDGVGGPMETIGETISSQAISLAMSSPFGVGGSAFRTVKDRRMFVDTVAFPAYKRETIHKVGLFDEEFVRNQDDEFNYRLREMGGRILMAPDIRSRYYSRGTIKALWRQYFQYGYWKVRVMQKHPRQMSLRQFIPPIFVTSLIILSFIATISLTARMLLAAVIGIYAVTNLSTSLIAASRNGWQYLPYLPLAFTALHFSYGAGFLYGLAKFAKCWNSEVDHG